MTLRALALALWSALHPGFARGTDAATLADAIASEAGDEYEAALVAYYVVRESGVRLAPTPVAWDPRAGISCGPLQMACAFVATHSAREQIRWWLGQVRRGHLVSLDSSARRAYARFAQAMALLARVRLLPTHS